MRIEDKLTIDEGIKTLEVMETNRFDTKSKKSLRLGIEALERLAETRKSKPEFLPKDVSDMRMLCGVELQVYLRLLNSEKEDKCLGIRG